ncbi:GNAT family N-acetyltransferase [Massilia sp. GCM10020059]|uniref:GNAT family N-acetyltransferase n=2 Tax=Massilia TaxID=149698 RepID=A0ABS8IP70_9BURK|nr:GNAT family N-acetyltransferase [Massilia agrisoli]MCC6070206.1 GNAT family N-acetyltransferase [Massilia agrisoli]
MTTTSYRVACAQDIPAMSAIRLAVGENKLRDPGRITPKMYADYLDALGRGWVCERDGVIAGFAYADREDGAIWALFVDPAHEGCGIGKHLLALATGYLFEQGHARVVLSTGPDTRADRFYTAQGWQRSFTAGDRDACFTLNRPAQPSFNKQR